MARRRRLRQIVGVLVIACLMVATARPAAAQSATSTTVHIVAWGETLYRIAIHYGVTIQAIIAANNLTGGDQIYAGQQLIIPNATTLPQSKPRESGSHLVQPGENLYRIGLRYGLSVAELMAANNLLNADQIFVGQMLTIPPSGTVTQAPSTPTTSTPMSTHVVKRGETLSAIAARYSVSLTVLIQVNKISNPSLIYVGQALSIPGYGTVSSQTADSRGTSTYIVQRGDTLFRIATRYNVSVNALRDANWLGNTDTIYVGQRLLIPGGSAAASSTADSGAAVTAPGATIAEGKQIVVVLSQQMVYAYEDGVLQRQFIVSTGLPGTPTVQGNFAIYLKYDSQRMIGPDYDLPNVPWVMYFYQGYGFHGTYWHNNFGQPMSHGCVNMRTAEAEWLYNWAPIGTPVRVTY